MKNMDKNIKTPQGDIFFWKALGWQITGDGTRPGLVSPYRKVAWPEGKLSVKKMSKYIQGADGIYGYWTLPTLCVVESHARKDTQCALVRCRIWGQVAFAKDGARAQHAQIVDMAVTADIFDDVSKAYPGIPLRYLRVPVRLTWPEHAKETNEGVLAAMGLVAPSRAPLTTIGPRPASGTQLANFRYGVYVNPAPFVGRTVGEVRQHLGQLWQVPNDAVGFKGKQKLDDNYVVQNGDDIEFHRRHSPGVAAPSGSASFRYGVYTCVESWVGLRLSSVMVELSIRWGMKDVTKKLGKPVTAYCGTKKLSDDYIIRQDDLIEFHHR